MHPTKSKESRKIKPAWTIVRMLAPILLMLIHGNEPVRKSWTVIWVRRSWSTCALANLRTILKEWESMIDFNRILHGCLNTHPPKQRKYQGKSVSCSRSALRSNRWFRVLTGSKRASSGSAGGYLRGDVDRIQTWAVGYRHNKHRGIVWCLSSVDCEAYWMTKVH